MGRQIIMGWMEQTTKSLTPLMLISTRNGTVPHLTRETWDILESNLPNQQYQSPAFLVPSNNWVGKIDVLNEYGKGLARFMALPQGKAVMMTTQDPSLPLKLGHNTNQYISVFHHGNRVSVDVDKFMNLIQAANPECFVNLCDGETPKESSNKRISKAVSKSIDYLDICLRKQEEIGVKRAVFGAIEGGYDLKARVASAKKCVNRPVDGFLLDGFHQNGQDSLNVVMNEVLSILREVIPILPQSKPRLYFGGLTPLALLDFIEAGIDVFDSTYAYLMTEEGKALTFPNTLGHDQDVAERNESLLDESDEGIVNSLTLDLKEKCYKDDFRPISQACCCYTCKKHTRGYINHLLATDELLAPVLLMMHNLHHMLVFFETIRTCIKNENLIKLRERLSQEKGAEVQR